MIKTDVLLRICVMYTACIWTNDNSFIIFMHLRYKDGYHYRRFFPLLDHLLDYLLDHYDHCHEIKKKCKLRIKKNIYFPKLGILRNYH